MRNDSISRKLLIGIIGFLICVLGAMAVLVFVDGPKVITRQVQDIKMTQQKLSIKVTWKEMKCDGYKLEISGGGERTVVEDYYRTDYKIKNIVPGETYRVEISGMVENGSYSRSTVKELETVKLKQAVKVNLSEYNGFKGDKFKIKAEGTGNISYSSANEKSAVVSEKGQVTLKRAGTSYIKVSLSGDDIYAAATKKIEVNVYPKELQMAGNVKTKNISDARAIVSWDSVKLARQYSIMKKNAATGKYEEVATTEGEETSIEITRDAGKYAVRAKATVHDKEITGKLSKPITIEGTTNSAESYSSAKTIKSLDSSNLEVVREIHGDGATRIPQSISLKDDTYVVSYVDMGGSQGKLISYKKDGELDEINTASGMGHANGTTYNPNTDRFYVVKTHKSIRSASCSTYSGSSKASEGTFTLPRVTSGIAYDESNNKYYLSKGNEIYVCDSDFNVEKFIHKFIRYNHAQDIGAYNGVVFVCTWVNGDTSYIDMYRASDGKYLGSYDVSIGEIESVIIDDGYLVILMNTRGSSNDYIYRTKERISVP